MGFYDQREWNVARHQARLASFEVVVVLERPPTAACQHKRRERREACELFAR